jgi:hypothetical protein
VFYKTLDENFIFRGLHPVCVYRPCHPLDEGIPMLLDWTWSSVLYVQSVNSCFGITAGRIFNDLRCFDSVIAIFRVIAFVGRVGGASEVLTRVHILILGVCILLRVMGFLSVYVTSLSYNNFLG